MNRNVVDNERPVLDRLLSRPRRLVVATVLIAATGGGAAVAASAGTPSTTPAPYAPNRCIAINGGDWNACNVGNSGAGNLPYRVVP
jgi:roadblock/LC7 domain-containing protein